MRQVCSLLPFIKSHEIYYLVTHLKLISSFIATLPSVLKLYLYYTFVVYHLLYHLQFKVSKCGKFRPHPYKYFAYQGMRHLLGVVRCL